MSKLFVLLAILVVGIFLISGCVNNTPPSLPPDEPVGNTTIDQDLQNGPPLPPDDDQNDTANNPTAPPPLPD